MKSRIFKVRHNDEEIRDELYIIVDAGGKVIDVFVNHEIYGRLKADLLLSSIKDVDIFSEQMKAGRISPLNHLKTISYHTYWVIRRKYLISLKITIRKKLLSNCARKGKLCLTISQSIDRFLQHRC